MYCLKIVLAVGILALAGCKEGPEQAANKLLVESTVTWEQYLELGPGSDQWTAQLALLRQISANLEEIVTEHPESSLAVELVFCT